METNIKAQVCDRCGSENLEQDLKWFGSCHSCTFWGEKLPIKDEPYVVRVDGRHYMIGDEPLPGDNRKFLGYGGAEFRIKFFDGRTAVTHNLWHQGTIPEFFRELLPDNAEFTK